MSGSAMAELRHRLTTRPPSSPQNNPVAVAHAALEQLRDAGDPTFLFLRALLEEAPKVSDEELIFHCILGIRQVILVQWPQLSHAYIAAVAKLTMFLGNHTLQEYRILRLAAYTTSAALWKRQWFGHATDGPVANPQQQALVQQMNSMMAQSLMEAGNTLDTPPQLLDYLLRRQQVDVESHALYLTALVAEFGGRSAVSYRMPIEFHQATHRKFEKEGPLQRILEWTMQQVAPCLQQAPATATAVLQLAMDCIGWEFGVSAFHSGNYGASSVSKTLLRPPIEWRAALWQPNLVPTLSHAHEQYETLAPIIRQLLLVFASLSGPIFRGNEERSQFAAQLLQVTLSLLQTATTQPDTRELLDTLQLFSRIIGNYRLAMMSMTPQLLPLLQGLSSIGNKLLEEQLIECKHVEGNIEMIENREWREEALVLVLDCAVVLSTDPWLLFSGTQESRKQAQHQLSSVLGSLYAGFVQCRTQMSAMEEYYFVKNESELDEVKEEILAVGLEEELASVSAMGRLNLSVAICCLSNAFEKIMPKLQSLWEGSGEVTPKTAASLEEARLLTMYICHLLTDDNDGESPVLPDAVLVACQDNPSLTNEIAAAVQALLKFSNLQAKKIAENPNNLRLSPILATSFLWFLNRWGPSYICPADYGHDNSSNSIVLEWSSREKAQQAVDYCISLCLHYQCYWPLEKRVQESAAKLLLSLGRRGGQVRQCMVASSSFRQMVMFHCLTVGQRHSSPPGEFEAAVKPKLGTDDTSSLAMVKGYHRLPYNDRSDVLTAIIVATSDESSDTAVSMLNESLKALHDAYAALMTALSSGHVGVDDVNAKEMVCLCVEMFCGIAHASEMMGSERIPQFVTGYLSQLAALMQYYAADLTICETLLRFFRDYTEQFISVLDKEQSFALFNATAELLRHYSTNHCASRVIAKTTTEAETEEEQAYSDISCAIQLLINLGTKDFIDACSGQNGIDSSQVTDMIFFGLQQILPLMTQGLLQFPTLCALFFELVGFMMETYPEKVCVLPFDLFDALLESLLFGMKHHNMTVAKCSLQGLTSIAREHLKTGVLSNHLQQHGDIFDKCCRRLLTEVVFQKVVMDRVEATGLALLPLAAVDLNRFAATVNALCQQVSDTSQRDRLQAAFQQLIRPDMMSKVVASGYEGRQVRLEFKDLFQDFVNNVHAFLVLV